MGLFAANCAPTATADPYGLRRAAVGMLQVCGLYPATAPVVLFCLYTFLQPCPALATSPAPAQLDATAPSLPPSRLQALIAADARLDLAAAVEAAAAVQPLEVAPASRAAVLDFLERRLEQLLVDGGAQVRGRGRGVPGRLLSPFLGAGGARLHRPHGLPCLTASQKRSSIIYQLLLPAPAACPPAPYTPPRR